MVVATFEMISCVAELVSVKGSGPVFLPVATLLATSMLPLFKLIVQTFSLNLNSPRLCSVSSKWIEVSFSVARMTFFGVFIQQ